MSFMYHQKYAFTLIYFDHRDHDPCAIQLHSVYVKQIEFDMMHTLYYCTQNRGIRSPQKRQFRSKP